MQFGFIVLTTSAGIMDHEEARRKNVGGKVLGFFLLDGSLIKRILNQRSRMFVLDLYS